MISDWGLWWGVNGFTVREGAVEHAAKVLSTVLGEMVSRMVSWMVSLFDQC